MTLPVNRSSNEVVLSTRLADVAAASTVCYVVAPVKGYLNRIYSVVEGTTNGAPEISVAINSGSALDQTITIASGGGAGDVDTASFAPSTSTFVDAGQIISLTTDGAGSTTVVTNFFVVIDPA